MESMNSHVQTTLASEDTRPKDWEVEINQKEVKSETSVDNQEDSTSHSKRRRIPNSKYDDGVGSADEDDSTHTAAKLARKNDEDFVRPQKASKQDTSESRTSHSAKSSLCTTAPSRTLSKSPNSSRIAVALSAEKISRILMRALQVFGPLSAVQCTELINKRRKPNIEEVSLKTVSSILQLVAATPLVNRIPQDDNRDVYTWYQSCNNCLHKSQGEESLREPLRVSTALAEVVRGKHAVCDAKERIQLIKTELKRTPEENNIRSLQNFLQEMLETRRELFDPTLHPKHTDLIYRRACRVARVPMDSRLNDSTSSFDANRLVQVHDSTEKQCYEFEEGLPFDVDQYNISTYYDALSHKPSMSKTERRPYNKRDKSEDHDSKSKKPVTPSAYSAWCREGMLVRHKSGRDGHIIRLKGPWIEVKFNGAKNSCATRVSDLQPVPAQK